MKFCRRRVCSEAHEVAPGLWQGDAPLPGINYRDFDLIVLAAYEHQPKSAEMGVDVFHAPLDDDPSRPLYPQEKQIALDAAREVAHRLRKGQRVLVTCALGKNRSGLVSALALRMAHGLSADAAINAVRRARPGALYNDQFVRALRRGR